MSGNKPVIRLELMDANRTNFAEYVMDINIAETICISLGIWLQAQPKDKTAAPTSYLLQ
jgi:hypothetical protein